MMNIFGTMSLSPNVAAFVPRQPSTLISQPTNVSQSSSLKLSANVAEFVPSWLSSGSNSPQNQSSPRKTPKAKRKKDRIVDNSELNVDSPKQKPTTSSLKANTITNSNKSDISEQKSNYHHETKEKVLSISSDNYNIESDFPALGASIKQTETPTVWNKPLGVSFSEKLKSNTTPSYFYNEPPLSRVRQKEENKSTVKSKVCEDMNRQTKTVLKDRVNKKSLEKILKQNNVNNNLEENLDIVASQSEDEGFSVVRNKTRKSNDGRSSDQNQPNRPIAWGDIPSDDQTKEKVKEGKRFSENRSKTSREQRGERLNHDTLSAIQKHRSSTLDDWRSGRNVSENRKEPRKNNIVNKGGSSRQSHKPTKDYYSLKSPQGASGRKNVNLYWRDNGRNNEGSEDHVKKIITAPVHAAAVETRTPLSYSDILKSKPNIQLPNPENVDGNERDILRIPSDGNEDEETEQQEVGEQEGKTKKKKKKKKKKKSTVEAPPQPVKKSKEALSLDFGDMLTKIMESSTAKRKPVMRTGGFLPAQAPLPTKEARNTKKSDLTRTHQAANILDSTAPIVFRSKEREFPKKKKPSAMRKILMKEREEKKLTREGNPPTEKSSDEENSEKNSSDEQHLDSDEIDPAEVKKSIHSRKFREYCDHDLDYDINGVVIKLLKELIRFQDRLYQKDPVKAKARRRFVCGLREVSKHAKLKKLKCVIVTPNLEPTKSKGGLDDLLSNIIDACHAQDVPVIFSLNRQVLGRVLLKKVPVSIVGIFYYDGAQNYFKNLMALTEVARETYRDKFNKAREKFLLEKQMAKDERPHEAGLTEIQKDEIVNNNDAVNELMFDGEEKQLSNDLARIEAFGENQTLTNSEAMNAETIITDGEEEMTKNLTEIEVDVQLSEIQNDED